MIIRNMVVVRFLLSFVVGSYTGRGYFSWKCTLFNASFRLLASSCNSYNLFCVWSMSPRFSASIQAISIDSFSKCDLERIGRMHWRLFVCYVLMLSLQYSCFCIPPFLGFLCPMYIYARERSYLQFVHILCVISCRFLRFRSFPNALPFMKNVKVWTMKQHTYSSPPGRLFGRNCTLHSSSPNLIKSIIPSQSIQILFSLF